MKPDAYICAVVLAFSFGIAMARGQVSATREPEYNGETLTQWLAGTNRESPAEFAEAIQHIGSNAVPFLIAILREERMTNSATNANPDKTWIEQFRRDRAMQALEVLGPEGRAAIPDLASLATNRFRFFDQSRAVSALARMTPYSVPALTNIIFNDTKAETRAIEELYVNDTNVSEVEGVLLSILHGTNTRSKLVVGAALARFRGRERFTDSLELIPALTDCLSTNIDADHETLTRNATYALANFGPRASSAIPAMLAAIRDGANDDHSDFNRCEAVGRALAKIDPDRGVQGLVAQLQLTNVCPTQCGMGAGGGEVESSARYPGADQVP
jgi:hypothetical protein